MNSIDQVDNATRSMQRLEDIQKDLIAKPIETECILPEEASKLNPPSIDLLNRLLEIKPQYRLRSLYSLERIAIYMGYNFANVRSKKVTFFFSDMLSTI